MKDNGNSFLELDRIHARLDEIFYRHQEAALGSRIGEAKGYLNDFEKGLRNHMRHEDQELIPLYEERKSRLEKGRQLSGEIYTHEHKKMLRIIGELKQKLDNLEKSGETPPRAILALLDRETAFKSLVEHHNLREHNHLYPVLDELTTTEERRELMRKFREKF